ncbi:MAG: beta-propeller domain-containing protein [Clostridia bacterium]|nr:beta-propeller domain-containing protein [Clostridia bacterium]
MLRDNYRRATDKIHVREDLLMDMKRNNLQGTKRNNNTKWLYRAGAAVAACLVLCGAIIGIKAIAGGATNRNAELPMVAEGGSRVDLTMQVNDYAELYGKFEQMAKRSGTSDNYLAGSIIMEDAVPEEEWSSDMDTMAEVAPQAMAEPSATDSANGTKEYSETNTQVRGVDEADIVKTDGDYIYTFSSEMNKLYIVAVDDADMTVLDEIELSSYGDNDGWYALEFYILNDRLFLIYNRYHYEYDDSDENEWYGFSEEYSGVITYDITDRSNVLEIAQVEQSGNYRDSRLVDGYLYIISNQYVYEPIEDVLRTYCPTVGVDGDMEVMPIEDIIIYEEPSDSSYTVITSIDATFGTEHSSHKALFGSAGTVYCNHEHILLADTVYENETLEDQVTEDGRNYQQWTSMQTTKLALFGIDAGSITELANGLIEGSLLNQFSMDEYNGYFRIVATLNTSVQTIYTDGIDTYEWNSKQDNTLYVLDSNLNQVGKIENVGQDETVHSVRFDGDIGYFVTFRQTDPLFAVDLSDPYNPTVLSALKIPGFSSYLHAYGDGLLFGLGYDADEETGWTECIKLSMFDVSDKADVTEAHTLILDEVYWSEATSNHKAILIDVEKNLIAFPADVKYYIYSYDAENGFVKQGEVAYAEDGEYWYGDMRGLYIDNVFYVVKANGIVALSLESFTVLNTLTFE